MTKTHFTRFRPPNPDTTEELLKRVFEAPEDSGPSRFFDPPAPKSTMLKIGQIRHFGAPRIESGQSGGPLFGTGSFTGGLPKGGGIHTWPEDRSADHRSVSGWHAVQYGN